MQNQILFDRIHLIIVLPEHSRDWVEIRNFKIERMTKKAVKIKDIDEWIPISQLAKTEDNELFIKAWLWDRIEENAIKEKEGVNDG